MKKTIYILTPIILLITLIFIWFLPNEDTENTLIDPNNNQEEAITVIYFQINDQILTVHLEDNSSAKALTELLKSGPITINMRDYAQMEKVGTLPQSLPRNDVPTQASYGDVILYQGNALVIYYDDNSWNFTRIGRIQDITQSELIQILGQGSVSVTLSLEKELT